MTTKRKTPAQSNPAVVKRPEYEDWLVEIHPSHERLTRAVVSLMQNLLVERKIEFLNIAGRTKTVKNALDKIDRKQYREPKKQLTDISGIRVVTFLESQVVEVTKIVRELFSVDEDNSLDRSRVLGSDKIGYRSTHFVCSLGPIRANLPEYESIENLKFEIQIRTVLQHAWAELAHDRSFKFGPGLPTPIQRKLNLYSGMLEIVDGAFDVIAKEIDSYTIAIGEQSFDQITNAEISKATLEKYLDSVSEEHEIVFDNAGLPSTLFDELKHFGIFTISDLKNITSNEIIRAYKSAKDSDTGVGFIRQIMMLADIDRYFSGPFSWRGIDHGSYQRLLRRYDNKKLRKLFETYGIEILPPDDDQALPTEDQSPDN